MVEISRPYCRKPEKAFCFTTYYEGVLFAPFLLSNGLYGNGIV